MTIFLRKFGTTLSGRQFGRESLAAFESSLKKVKDNEEVVVDFEGVVTFTPSWGDEFLSSLLDRFGKYLIFKNTDNFSVQATLRFLEKIHKINFKIENPN
jgi:hypothetical protein